MRIGVKVVPYPIPKLLSINSHAKHRIISKRILGFNGTTPLVNEIISKNIITVVHKKIIGVNLYLNFPIIIFSDIVGYIDYLGDLTVITGQDTLRKTFSVVLPNRK